MRITALLKLMLKGSVDMSGKKQIYMIVGRNIQQAREKAGYTQERFSELVNIDPKSLSAIELVQWVCRYHFCLESASPSPLPRTPFRWNPLLRPVRRIFPIVYAD